MKKQFSNKFYILIFLLPALILFCGVLIAPIGASAYFSFFDWDGIGEKTFIGFHAGPDFHGGHRPTLD